MPTLKRRQFLQAAGSALAAAGLGQVDIGRQSDRYHQVLAQTTNRKLALLVGVNEYPADIQALQGCLTDVRMQQELLVHRYGFNPADILTLADAAATRQNLLDAFETHLIEQAQPGDVVVFHFSGHGALVRDPDPIPANFGGPDGYNGTLLPYDARLDMQGSEVNDIMGKTLFLLASALKTDLVTVVLDCCHSGGGLRGDVIIRSVAPWLEFEEVRPSDVELAVQERWMAQLGWSEAELKARRTQGIARGAALGSAQANQLAADASFGAGPGQFYAGAFTYALTRYLWQQPGNWPLQQVFVDLARSTRDIANSARMVQSPSYEVEPGRNFDQEPVYFSLSKSLAAEAVILAAEADGTLKFWLGGVSSQSLAAFEQGTIFALMDSQGNEIGQVEQTRRVGLEGYGTLLSSTRSQPAVGQLLREQVRGVPAELTLRVGLDASLEEDLAEAQSQLSRLSRIEPVAVDGRHSPHILLGRMTEQGQAIAATETRRDVGELGSLGLFAPGLVAIRSSFGHPQETVTEAIKRLIPKFKLLLAGQVLRSVVNNTTTSLEVGVVVQSVNNPVVVGHSASHRGGDDRLAVPPIERELSPLRSGSEITVTVINNEFQSLHVSILAISSSGSITVLHPTDWSAPESEALLEAGQSITIPRQTFTRNTTRDYCANPSAAFHLCLSGTGYAEILTLASTRPLREALRSLQRIAEASQIRSGTPLNLETYEPIEVIDGLLSNVASHTPGNRPGRDGITSVDAAQFVALSTVLYVVED